MPELPEVEAYRRLAEARALGRTIAAVHAPDAWFLKSGLTAPAVTEALLGRTFTAARRTGKRLWLPTSGDGPILGLRFGMTGRLLVDGRAGVDQLMYSSPRENPAWDRFGVDFDDGGNLRLRDPRRLGGVELDSEESRLGPDALGISLPDLRRALANSKTALKARLLDQSKLSGVGNLAADEALWRAGLSPERPAGSLDANQLRRLHRHLNATLHDLIERGGSHTGDFVPARSREGVCPKDGTPLRRATIGGRTTYWCPKHQG